MIPITYLLVGSTSIGTLVDEFDNIKKWAENNNMKIHPSKTKGLIVSRARSRTTQVPSQPFIEGAERVTTLRVLGVILDSKLTMSDHVSQVLSTCASLTFALRLLRTHGLKQDELHLVARATTVASILYASRMVGVCGRKGPPTLGSASVQNASWGYLPSDFPTIESLVDEADRRLFKSTSQNRTHVLQHLFTVKPTPTRSLRARAHNFILPLTDNRNFVSKALYNALCPPSG